MVAESVVARRHHYGQFYGLEPIVPGGRRVTLVYGNCQAESIRVVLEASSDELLAVRMPPVHELEREDLPHLTALLEQTDLLIAQPVRDDWRDLPLGTAQIGRLARRAQPTIGVPVIRHTGLHPHGALVRTPWMGDPPTVPYHDLRTILAVARGGDRPTGHGRADGYRAVEAASIAELRRREERHGLVPASDLLRPAGIDAMHTINHPGNAVLVPLAGRLLAAAGIDAPPVDPGRTLLASIQAPLRRDVLEALDLDPAAARETWQVGGRSIDDETIAADQCPWYRDRAPVVQAALDRYAPAIEALGL
ncbi:MAG: WcbI family polysaccharide biosynthesis putative acetyltransferase [Solirubrobacteraceae bacterium]|nr:WcbI family polysaccharide biosynthesis putative acetyltransferase [Solirubrobacteraceae bacterium]